MKRIHLLFFASLFAFISNAQDIRFSTSESQPNGGSNADWLKKDSLSYVRESDDRFISAQIKKGNNLSNVLTLTGYNFNVNNPGKIVVTGIEVVIERFAGHSNIIKDALVQLRLNGVRIGDNKAGTDFWTPGEQVVSYGGIGELWGTSLTFDDIKNNSTFGLDFQARNTTPNSGGMDENIYVDAIYLRVYYTFADIVAPVQFISFDAKKVTAGTQLSWKVGTEDNVKGYEVEKSVNGSTYSKIAFVPATAGSAYTFTDVQSNQGSVYFRIKNVDNDGKFSFSPVVRFTNGKTGVELKAFPTQVTGGKFTLQHDAAVTGSGIIISSLNGSIVRTVVPASGSMQTPVNVAGLRPGMYLVRFANGNGQPQTTKIIL